NAPVDLLLVRPHDIPEYVQDGVVDAGITGANLVVESQAEVTTLAELGFARCTLEAAVPVDAAQAALADLEGLRVATAYPTSTRARVVERAGGGGGRDPGRPAGHGCTVRARAGRAGPDRDPRCDRGRSRLGSTRPAQGRRGHVDPRRAGREARPVSRVEIADA